MARPVLSMLLCSLLLCAALSARAASVTSTWLGGTGDWTDPAHWSGAVVPQNTDTDAFDAVIDDGNAAASQVTLDSADTIGSLQVDAGDALIVTPTGQLTLEGSSIVNAGEITLSITGFPTPSAYSIVVNSRVVLSGGGTIHLDGGGISGFAGDPGLVNLDNRIDGWGGIYVQGYGAFENHGVIEANVAGKDLGISAGTNYGVVRAIDGASASFGVSGYGVNNRGAVEAIDGSSFSQADTASSGGGSYTALGHSTMALSGGFGGTHFVTDSDSEISLFGDGEVSDCIFEGHIVLSKAIAGTNTNLGELRASLDLYSSATIVNQGHIDLEYAQLRVGGVELSLTGGGAVTLDSPFEVDLIAPLRNLDNEIQGSGNMFNLVQNGGAIEATNGSLLVLGQTDHSGVFAAGPGGTLEMGATVTGSGAWRADGGLIHVTGNVGTTGNIEVLHGGSLVVDTEMSGGSLVVDRTSSLDVEGVLRVAGNVDFDGAHNGRWTFGPSGSLETNGIQGAAVSDWSYWQSAEAAGRDLGLVAAGFASSNFYLPELVIGTDGRLFLRDGRDNGNRVGGDSEAVYVDTLVFSDSLGLLDLNGITLYYNHLVGSASQIIDVAVPEPGSDLLLAMGLLAAIALRRSSTASQQVQSKQHRDRDPEQPQQDPTDPS